MNIWPLGAGCRLLCGSGTHMVAEFLVSTICDTRGIPFEAVCTPMQDVTAGGWGVGGGGWGVAGGGWGVGVPQRENPEKGHTKMLFA